MGNSVWLYISHPPPPPLPLSSVKNKTAWRFQEGRSETGTAETQRCFGPASRPPRPHSVLMQTSFMI